MNVLLFLVPLAVLLAACGVAGFAWAVRSGQFEDTHTPALRVLLDDEDVAPRRPDREEHGRQKVKEAHRPVRSRHSTRRGDS